MGVKYNSSPINSDGLAFCLDFSNPGCYDNANTEVEILPAHTTGGEGFRTSQDDNGHVWTGIAFSVDEIDTDGYPIIFARSIDNRTKRIYGQEDTTFYGSPELLGKTASGTFSSILFEALENGPGWSQRYIQLNASGKKVRIAKWELQVESLDDLQEYIPVGVAPNSVDKQPILSLSGYGRITELLGNVDLVGGYTIGQEGDNGTYTPFGGDGVPITRQVGPSLHGTYGLGNPAEAIDSLHTPVNWYQTFNEQGRPRPWVFAFNPGPGYGGDQARLGASITDRNSTNTISGLEDDVFMPDGIIKGVCQWSKDWNQDPNKGFTTSLRGTGSGRANKDTWPGDWDDLQTSPDIDGNGTSDRTIWQHGPLIEREGLNNNIGCIRAVAGYWYDNWPTNTRFGNASFLESRNFPIPPTPREEFKRLPLTKFCSKKVTALAPASGPTVSSGQIRYDTARGDLEDLNLGTSTSGLNPDDFPLLLGEQDTNIDYLIRGSSGSTSPNGKSITLLEYRSPFGGDLSNLVVGKEYILRFTYGSSFTIDIPRVYRGFDTVNGGNVDLNGFGLLTQFNSGYDSIVIGWGGSNGTSSQSLNPTDWYDDLSPFIVDGLKLDIFENVTDEEISTPIAIWIFHVKTGYMAKWHVKNSQLTDGEDPGRNHNSDDLITGDEYEVFMYTGDDAEDITHPVIARGGVPAFKHFNGTSHRMWIDTLKYGNNDKRIDEATIAAWVRTDYDDASGNTWNSNNWAILDFDRSEVFTFALTGGGYLSFSARTSNNGGIGGTYHDIVGNTKVNDGHWHHVCITRSTANQRIRMYIDGKLDREWSANGNLGYMGRGSTRYGMIGDGSEKESPTDTTSGNNIYYEGDISAIWLYDEKEMSEREVYDFYMGTAPKFGRLE